MFAPLFMLLAQQDAPSPYVLPLGRPGQVVVAPGTLVDTASSRQIDVAQVAAMADGHRFVYLGESHTTQAHHDMQAAVIEALVARGRDVVVGFEMFSRPVQASLNPWTLGWWSDEEFQVKADWKGQWNMDYKLYKPVFDAVKKHRLPMAALNVPREWVRAVSRQGLQGLSQEQRAQLPSAFDLTNRGHRVVFDSLTGGHPMPAERKENMYAAQVLWDVAMADSALRYLDTMPKSPRTVMVIVVGSGHVMYGQGINWRVAQRTGEKGLTVVMADSKEPLSVSRGLADVVYVARATQ